MNVQALVIRARWMNESERYQPNEILKAFQAGAEILTMYGDGITSVSIPLTDSRWESGHFHLGHFQDECFKMLPKSELRTRWAALL